MGNVVDYLIQYGKYKFSEKQFNHIDSLILCQLSYLKFEGIIPGLTKRRKSMNLMDVFTHPDREKLFADERFEVVNRSLFEAAAFSLRFQNSKLNYMMELTDIEQQMQFAAMTFFLEDGTIYIAYRGTDETIVGWKEDFNMAFKEPIPSQLLAAEYLNQAAKKFDGPFMIGGHSKGGNLSVYASMKCEPLIKQRISRIYTNDGPGFVEGIFASQDFESIKSRIVKIVPQSSMIGMLLQHQEDYMVVASTGKGGMGQHDPFTWEIENGDFVYHSDLNQSRKMFNERLNNWVDSLNDEQRTTFIETLFQIISVTEADTLMDLTEEWKDNALKMLNALKDVDADTRKMIAKIIRAMLLGKVKKKKLT